MKRIRFFVNESSIAKLLGGGVEMMVEEDSKMLDVVAKTDEIISKKGGFPIRDYKSLLHMVYNPAEGRFYRQVGLHAYTTPGHFYNIRDNVQHELMDGMTIILIPFAGCISGFEKPLSYEEFTEALTTSTKKELKITK